VRRGRRNDSSAGARLRGGNVAAESPVCLTGARPCWIMQPGRTQTRDTKGKAVMRWPCFCLLAGAAVVAGTVLGRHPAGAETGKGAAASRPTAPELRGAGSCAAAACHNGNGSGGEKGSEYTTWVLHDPHSRAFEVLYGKKSLQIEKNRQRPPGVKEDHPESDPLCLNCHVQPGVEKLSRRKQFALEDGVGCEACHGAAGDWLTQHYTAAWRAKTAGEKRAEGMADTKDLRVRAETCVRCHVGEGDFDVNHDLIAAGHPRLAFEYAAFHASLPKHWDAAGERMGRPDFDAQLWMIGQVVTSRAALRLLAERAADPKKPWPEFAESDCFACHHDLADQKWRRDSKRAAGRAGSAAWGTWHFALDDVVRQHPPKPGLAYPKAEIADLRERMTAPDPDRAEVRADAGRAAKALDLWLPALGERTFDWRPDRLADALNLKLRDEIGSYGWDEAAQLYLALKAQPRAAGQRDLLKRLGESLAFPPGYRSPAGFDPTALRRRLSER
jgi:hypothetical protein